MEASVGQLHSLRSRIITHMDVRRQTNLNSSAMLNMAKLEDLAMSTCVCSAGREDRNKFEAGMCEYFQFLRSRKTADRANKYSHAQLLATEQTD